MITPLHHGLFIIALLFLLGPSPGSAQKELSPLQKFSADALVKYVGFSGDSEHLFIGTTTGEFTTWDISRNRLVQRVIIGREARQYVLGPKGTLYTLHADGTFALRELNTGNSLKLFKFYEGGDKGKYPPGDYPPYPPGQLVYHIRQGPKGRLYFGFFDTLTNQSGVSFITPIGERHPTPWKNMPEFSANGKVAAVPMGKDKVAICDADTGKTIRTITVVPYKLYGPEWPETLLIAISPDGKYLASAEYSREGYNVNIINVATNKTIRKIKTRERSWPIEELLFSPNGKFLAVKG
ncbi:MAG: WD40 repeat domain-containing protein, partial [Fimbriimonadales bacterium]|nr:WD40 repeat domain-containing protein [Fimbriimonadales bacterium]